MYEIYYTILGITFTLTVGVHYRQYINPYIDRILTRMYCFDRDVDIENGNNSDSTTSSYVDDIMYSDSSGDEMRFNRRIRRLEDTLNRKSEKIKQKNFKKYDDISCIICLTNFALNDKINKLNCSHIFHNKCLVSWIKINQICPICRASF